MDDLIDLLNKNTSKTGNWSISYNEHTDYYLTPETYYEDMGFDKEDLKNVDFSQGIYRLCWSKDTPVGHYDFFGNNIDDILKQIKIFLNQ